MYEVNAAGNIVWGPYNSQTPKGFRYECDYPGIIALEQYINTSTSSCFTSSITEVEESFLIYPNPTSGLINIELSSLNQNFIEFSVTNISGQEIQRELVNNRKNIQLNLQDFSEGLYFINLINRKGETYAKRISYIR